MDEEKALIIDPRTGQAVEKTANDLILDGAGGLEDLTIEQTVFCVDTSYSMSASLEDTYESKVSMLRKVMNRFIEDKFDLSEFSRFGLIKFSNEARIMVEITDNKERLLDEVDRLRPEQSTNMHLGLEAALKLLSQEQKLGWVPRIVLISDGQPNSQDQVVDVITRHKDMRVVVDSIYLGSSTPWEAPYLEFMKKLADITGGKFVQIESGKDFEKKFIQAVDHKALPAANLGRLLDA